MITFLPLIPGYTVCREDKRLSESEWTKPANSQMEYKNISFGVDDPKLSHPFYQYSMSRLDDRKEVIGRVSKVLDDYEKTGKWPSPNEGFKK